MDKANYYREFTKEEYRELWVKLEKKNKKLQAKNKQLVNALKKWLKHAEDYDPYAPNSASRYGMAAPALEKAGIIKRIKKILALQEKPNHLPT